MDGIFVLQTKNRFDSLIIDTGNCENHIEDADIESVKPLSVKKQPRNKRPNVVVSRYPQGNMNHKLIPGNSSYSNIVKKGRKMSILGDSIPSTIEMKEFNHCLKERINSHLIRKGFPGATPLELAHYCIPTLIRTRFFMTVPKARSSVLKINLGREI